MSLYALHLILHDMMCIIIGMALALSFPPWGFPNRHVTCEEQCSACPLGDLWPRCPRRQTARHII